MLNDAIEEDAEKTPVQQSRRPLVDQREHDPDAGRLGIEMIKPILGKAWVAELDPPGVVGDHTDPGRVVSRVSIVLPTVWVTVSAEKGRIRPTLFGMTEAFGPYCGYPADTDMPATAWGSCGKPFPGMEIRIVEPDSGEPVRAETSGVIAIRGPHTLRGICRRSREELFTADGFYPTGDLGHLNEDEFLFYHGRSDDMFKVSGATVYPSEVERALRTIDGVENAYVTNVSRASGERVGAAVVSGNQALTAEQLRSSARTLLSAFKVPTVWLLLESDDDVPRGGTGKPDTHRLRGMLIEVNQLYGTRVQG